MQMVLGISEDKKIVEGLKRDQVQNQNISCLINHQSFWNDSGGGNTFLSDMSGAHIPSELSHVGSHMLCRFPSSDRQNEVPETSAVRADLKYHENKNNTFSKVVHNTKSCQQNDTENTNITNVFGKDSRSVAAVETQGYTGKEKSSCGICTNRRSSKEELLAKRKLEIIMSRKNSSLNKLAEEECESLGQQAKEGMEQNKEDKNSSNNSLWCSNSAHEPTKTSSQVNAISVSIHVY